MGYVMLGTRLRPRPQRPTGLPPIASFEGERRTAGGTIGVIAALPGEARNLRKSTARWGGSSPEVALSGIGPEAAGAAAEHLARSGAAGLVSFGYAGALKAALRSGTLILPDQILAADGARHRADSVWLAALSAAIAPDVAVVTGALLSMPRMLTSAEDKHAAHLATGAVAVDMESAAIAAAAERHGLPFIAVRAVLDEADHAVPSAILAAVDKTGSVGLGRLALALLARRREIATLIPLARAARASNQTLMAVCRLGGPRFGLVG
jgi:hopanoid-associated phosphorylase